MSNEQRAENNNNLSNICSLLPVTCYLQPEIIDETEDFAVVYKPPRMHCAPLKKSGGGTLLDWYAAVFPPITGLSGRKEGEGGLLHRLDFETQGLVLFAKNQQSLDHLLRRQNDGNFVKEYRAICQKTVSADSSSITPDSSYPPSPVNVTKNGFPQTPFVIGSFFRAFGPGRKQVRPIADAGYRRRKIASDKGGYYRTEVLNVSPPDDRQHCAVTVRLCRGFRHQARCHLAWIGCPVLNDPLYGNRSSDGILGLCATGLVFTDPGGKPREYRIGELENQADSM